MNQILDYDVGGSGDNNGKPNKPNKKNKKDFSGGNNFNNGMGGGGKTSISDKVIKVFAFLMIILAIALIASGAMSLLKNKKDETKKTKKTSQVTEVKAEITADLDEIAGVVTINVDSPITISKMIYSWDEGHDNVVSGEKQTSLQEETIVPSGKHALHVQVTDEENNKTVEEFEFDSPVGIDTTQPKITLTVTEDKKLLVTASDDTSISYVTYTWNEGDTVTMTPEEENPKEYEFELEIPKGKNTIVVFAVDGSEMSNAKTVSKVLEGVTKPLINYGFLDDEGKVLQITCTHENGIKKIYYTLNGQAYQWEAQEGELQKEVTFTQEAVPGHNKMTITVTSVDDTTADFNPEWDYGAEEEQPSEETTQTETESDEGQNESEEENENPVSDEATENN